MDWRKAAIVREIQVGINVLFRQEGGVDEVWGDGLLRTVQRQPVGAENERCTNYILVNWAFVRLSESEPRTIGTKAR